MNSEEFNKALRSEPFQAFRLHMSNGRTLTIRHPEFCMVSPNGRTAAVYPHVPGEPAGLEVVDIMLVQSIEFLPPGKSNGKQRKAG